VFKSALGRNVINCKMHISCRAMQDFKSMFLDLTDKMGKDPIMAYLAMSCLRVHDVCTHRRLG
jgi:hypothetical protein